MQLFCLCWSCLSQAGFKNLVLAIILTILSEAHGMKAVCQCLVCRHPERDWKEGARKLALKGYRHFTLYEMVSHDFLEEFLFKKVLIGRNVSG